VYSRSNATMLHREMLLNVSSFIALRCMYWSDNICTTPDNLGI
jgi:hypothetical protein